MTHPYRRFVADVARLAREAREMPLGGLSPAPRPVLAADAPVALVFSPHPDDECLTGGLPLRLLREAKMRVVNVAVTLGSNPERRSGRLAEVEGACAFLGFELLSTRPGGLERVNAMTRAEDPRHWWTSVDTVAAILAAQRPRVVFAPHEADWNSTHIGTSLLVMDALRAQDPGFVCHFVETEYWAPLARPNLMVESSPADVGDLVAATSFHVGEVRRNPYHASLPAWMQDTVRRGGEVLGGQGGAIPDFAFGTLYRARRFERGPSWGSLDESWPGARTLGAAAEPGALFG